MTLNAKTWLLGVSTVTAWCALWSCGSSSSNVGDDLLQRTRVAQYQQWNRVNPQPVHVDEAFAGSCSGPNIDPAWLPDPHANTYITVYVNDTGKQAMLTQATPTYPVGTVIVKQKSSAADGSNVQLLTVMEKKEAGFNTQNGDWDYAVLSGDAAQIQAHGKLTKCQGCHAPAQREDYIYRYAYLPSDIANRLRSSKADLTP